jgi:SAM-dependent methyltransferase
MDAGTPKSSCPVCGEIERQRLFRKNGFPIARCRGCGHVYVDAEISSSELQARYGRDYYQGSVFHDYLAEREERIESARGYVALLSKLKPSARLLDVGCATGFFLEAASVHWDVTGVELSPFAAEYARREFGHRVLTGDVASVDLPDASFDVITLWNTIEHVPDPRAVLGCVARLAAPDALVVLTTGDAAGTLAHKSLIDWELMTPPEHLHFFQPRTITLLLEGAGLEVRRIAHDGHIANSGPLATRWVRLLAAGAGLGNVMTVFARQPRQPPASRRLGGAFARRLRPVARV